MTLFPPTLALLDLSLQVLILPARVESPNSAELGAVEGPEPLAAWQPLLQRVWRSPFAGLLALWM